MRKAWLAAFAVLLPFLTVATETPKKPTPNAQYNPKELGVEKTKKSAKWEGPDYGASKSERSGKTAKSGKRATKQRK